METEKALQAAIEAKMPSLMASVEARRKRQALALAGTSAAIVEVEAALKDIDSRQADLVAEAERTQNASGKKR